MTGKLILVTGATGYIASRLIPRLLGGGYRVRAFARHPERLQGRAWLSRVQVVRGDTMQSDSLAAGMQGVDTAYYLIHNMASGRGYVEVEHESARRFASAAAEAKLQHIIYLGGLADPNAKNIAPHMRSRIETGIILRQGRVPVTEFRAGVIAGAGSISFEMIRFLTECFPLLVGPTWLRNKVQPIAADNVIDYLVAALDRPGARGGIYEMGGPEVMLYSDTMLRYAKQRGLKRSLFTLPGIPIPIMARAVDWLTPVPFPIATPLIGGLQSDSVVLDDAARRLFPEIEPIPYHTAVTASLEDLVPARLERVRHGAAGDVVTMKHEGFFIDYRRVQVNASAEAVFSTFTSMGGRNGWPYADSLWRLRGWLDRIFSTQRTRRDSKEELGRLQTVMMSLRGPLALSEVEGKGRSNPLADESRTLKVGDQVDYYRVEALEPGRILRLYSLLRAPGEGWMEWRVEAGAAEGTSALAQTAFFAPRGMLGFAYWFFLGPVHRFVFRGLIQAIKERSQTGL